MVVKFEELCEPLPRFADRRIPLQVHVFVFHRAPEPLSEYVVEASSASSPICARMARIVGRENLLS